MVTQQAKYNPEKKNELAQKVAQQQQAAAAPSSQGKAPSQINKADPVVSMLRSMQGEIARVLPDHIKPDRMVRICLTELRTNRQLCYAAINNRESFFQALLEASALGIEPGQMGQGYLIPYGTEVKFILGYKGLMELAYRTQQVSFIQAFPAKQKDELELVYGSEGKFHYKPNLFVQRHDDNPIIAYLAYMRYKDGAENFTHMLPWEVEDHRDKFSPSKAKSDSPWKKHFVAMSNKTVLKKLLKFARISVEVQAQLSTAADRTEQITGGKSSLEVAALGDDEFGLSGEEEGGRSEEVSNG